MIKPITPDEIKHEIPDFIIEAVNTLLKKKWDKHLPNEKYSFISKNIQK